MSQTAQGERERSGAPLPDPDADATPTVSVCEAAPGTRVFLEDGCTDGWISTDTTVDVSR